MKRRLDAPLNVRAATATRLGLTVEDYDKHLAAGEKWCYEGQAWHPVAAFTPSGKCRTHKRSPVRTRPRMAARSASEQWWNDLLARVLVK